MRRTSLIYGIAGTPEGTLLWERAAVKFTL